MASRARRLSSSACGLLGELSPLNSELLANGLMPNQPTSCFFIVGPQPGLVGHHLGLGRVGRADDLELLGILLDQRLDVRPVVRGDAGEAGPARLLGPVERLDQLLDLRRGVLAALLEAGDAPEVDVVEAGLLQALVEALLELLELAAAPGCASRCSYQEKPRCILSRRPLRALP